MAGNATWFMDAAAMGGGTPAGTAKVITQSLAALTEDQKPKWMKGKSEKEINDIVTQSICEAVEASYVVKDYMDKERSKGRDFDEIYGEVQPYLDYVSRPLDEIGAQAPQPDFDEPRIPDFEEQAARREVKKASAPHRSLRAWPEPPSF
mmetsp:Transcript_17729/g.31018  ORF Transcript_17729/g.31018 Transcript_17729/m.31018 type:complete len:149 (+) Transcript_17729:57-503(+)|eukprot:CAMPEP_0197623878 /NCGR_PEP_ID=MMETSP1338-20131121/3771_1 /TAXON_ID=43686 ORGANISM="Pelagodinium beii, Strain RCC1491" /NCGR_SAMPLE_ID=MMETSP1338 /ASSEMBLY_ACC=CAM_ASM_000754 /LENGTH=148 /DNA_ID=CAMNT_0043193965 /DNA_START=57 /DNA_END=503 /DNA_ORIENTATION=+